MSRFNVLLSENARANLVEVLAFIERESSPVAADLWLEAFDRLLTSLESMPRRFPLARETKEGVEPTLYRALLHSHRILFTIEGTTIEVHHIRHGAREDLDQP